MGRCCTSVPRAPAYCSRTRRLKCQWAQDTGRDSYGRARSRDLGSALPRGVKSSEDTIAKSLEGDYRPEHLFALQQSLAAFHYYRELVVDVVQEIQRQLGSLETAATAEATVPKRTKASAYQRRRYELTNVPGISAITAQTILCEIGTDVSRFRNASAFASWLGLCPENKISGCKGCGRDISCRIAQLVGSLMSAPDATTLGYTSQKQLQVVEKCWDQQSGAGVAQRAHLRGRRGRARGFRCAQDGETRYTSLVPGPVSEKVASLIVVTSIS
jgi:hypothetical protein